MYKDISYDMFKDTLLAYNNQLEQEARKLDTLLDGHKLSNGFIPKSTLNRIQGYRAQEHMYNTVSDARKRFLMSVPLKVRKKYLRQMAKDRRSWDL